MIAGVDIGVELPDVCVVGAVSRVAEALVVMAIT
jgi:hypothetical protein